MILMAYLADKFFLIPIQDYDFFIADHAGTPGQFSDIGKRCLFIIGTVGDLSLSRHRIALSQI